MCLVCLSMHSFRAFPNEQKTNTHRLLQDGRQVCEHWIGRKQVYCSRVIWTHNIVWHRCCGLSMCSLCYVQSGLTLSHQDAVGCGLSTAVTGLCFHGEWNIAVVYNRWQFQSINYTCIIMLGRKELGNLKQRCVTGKQNIPALGLRGQTSSALKLKSKC